MGDQTFPRAAVRKIEKRETFPLIALNGVTDLRNYLNEVESEAILRAHELGATAEDIADALAITRQGVYYKLKALKEDALKALKKDATDEPSEASTDADPPESITVIVRPDSEGAPIPDGSGRQGRPAF